MNSEHCHKKIAIIGCWEVRNFGSHLTYYALYKVLEERGYKTLMVGCPQNAPYQSNGIPEYYLNIPYKEEEICKQFADKFAMRELNYMADTFIVGSDQLWNPALYRYFGRFTFLDYIYENKKKISYATSFGESAWNGPASARDLYSIYLKRFDYVSVRETSGVEICRNIFGINADWRLDPVFLCEPSTYSKMADKSSIELHKPYLAAYILDCDDAKAASIAGVAKKLSCEYRILKDPNLNNRINKKWNQERNFFVEDWLKWIRDSKYVITDSFHGMCVALMFKKRLIIVKNTKRGAARFDDYGEKLGILDVMVSDYQELNTDLFDLLDYKKIHDIINSERNKSLTWLYNAIEADKLQKELSLFDEMSLRLDDLAMDMRSQTRKNLSSTEFLFKFKSKIDAFLSQIIG